MLTAREAAVIIGAGESSVRMWAKEGRFEGARLEESPVGSYWLIPETALKGFEARGRGRPPKPAADVTAKPAKKAGAKKTTK